MDITDRLPQSPPQDGLMHRLSDFSIEHILHRAGAGCRPFERPSPPMSSSADDEDYGADCAPQPLAHQQQQPAPLPPNCPQRVMLDRLSALSASAGAPLFDWLQYSRYHPPRPQQKSVARPGHSTSSAPVAAAPVRRTPGRLPRVPFSGAQLRALELAYRQSTYLSSAAANALAERLELTNTRVKIWFQNRRARERRERRERDGGDGVAADEAPSVVDEPSWRSLELAAGR